MQQQQMQRWFVAALVCASLVLTAAVSSQRTLEQASPSSKSAAACPFSYQRHNLDDIRSKAKRPYLFGGIYDPSRPCPNCKRGGLWANYCGFRGLEKVPFWHMQMCNSSTVDAVIADTLGQSNAADVLTMTPCDMYPYLRGRTTWIIG